MWNGGKRQSLLFLSGKALFIGVPVAAGKGEQATGSLAAPQRGENWFPIWGEGRGGSGGAVCGRQAWCPVFAPGLSKVALVFWSLYTFCLGFVHARSYFYPHAVSLLFCCLRRHVCWCSSCCSLSCCWFSESTDVRELNGHAGRAKCWVCAGRCDNKERSKVENLGTQEAEGWKCPRR